MQRSVIEGRKDSGVKSGRGRLGRSVILPGRTQILLGISFSVDRPNPGCSPIWVVSAAHH